MTEHDAEQVKRAKTGDRAAYGALVDAYQGMVFATALNITGNYSDAEDVVQDSFLRAFQRLNTLTDPMKFPAWLRTVASRAALQLLRKRRRVPAETLDESVENRAESDTESPAAAYARAEFAGILWREVGELPPKTREAILLFYMEGYSVKRAAAYVGCSENALKARLHFGREKLRESLLEKVEAELRDHRPTEKHRNAILAALPPSVAGTGALFGTGGGGAAASMLSLTPFNMAAIAAVIFLVAGLTAVALWPQAAPPGDTPAGAMALAADSEEEHTSAAASPKPDTQLAKALHAAVPKNAVPEAAPEGATLSGRVLDADTREGIASVEVTLRGGETRLTTNTDASGAYRFEGLSAQRYRIFCGKAKGYYELEHGELQEVELGDNEHFEGLDFALEPGVFASVSGTVLMPDGSPAKGAKVAAFKEFSAPGRNHHVECMTRENGSFLAEELPVGAPIYVSAGAPGFHSKREGPLVLPAEGIQGVTVHLYPAGSISGVVVDKAGRPISDPEIGVKGTRWEHYEGGTAIVDERTQTKEDGTFILANLQAGGYSLIAETEQRAIMWSGGLWVEPDPEDLIRVAEGQHVTGVTLVFDYAMYKMNQEAQAQPNAPTPQPAAEPRRPFRGGRIEGQVLRADSGEPVTSFRLSTNQDGRYAEAIKHPEGRFKIEAGEEAQLNLHVTAMGFAPSKTPIDRPTDPEAAVEVTIRLEPGCVVDGRVIDWDGNPVGGAVIYLEELGSRYSMDNRADASVKTDGTFRLDGLTPGVHRLFAVHPEFAFAWIDIEARISRPAKVTIPLARGGNIEGVVTRAGQPVNETWVRALDETFLDWPNLQNLANDLSVKRNSQLYARTDASGAYILTNLPPGRYLLAINTEFDTMQETLRQSGNSSFIEAIVEPGMVTRVDLALPPSE